MPPIADARDQFVGAWTLASCTVTQADGSTVYPYGHRASGTILYTPDGWMSCQLRGNDFDAGRAESSGLKPVHYSAYYGSFSVDEQRKVVVHHVSDSSEPIIHGDQERNYRFEGDSLTLEAETNGVTARLEWSRSPPGPA